MIETFKRFTMAILFTYLGGALAHTSVAAAFGATGFGALKIGLSWPAFVFFIIALKSGFIGLP